MAPTNSPIVFVSWTQRNEGWTGAQAEAWRQAVFQFASLLRAAGIAADLDLFHLHEAHIDWTRWGPLQVETSDKVVAICSAGWRERFEGTNRDGTGVGAMAEADVLLGLFDDSAESLRSKLILVLLPGLESKDVVPTRLRGFTRVNVSDLTMEDLKPLLHVLLEVPQYETPPIGSTPELTPAAFSPQGAADALKLADQGVKPGPAPDYESLSPATRALIKPLSDRDDGVRFSALMALEERLDRELLPAIEPLLEDSYALVRQTAIEYYARLAGSEGTHRLVAALADRDDGVRFSALMALEERLDRELLPAIEPLLEDSYALVRQTAIEYYARLTGSEGTHRLVAALADRDDGVRFSALMALEERLDRELLPAIEPLLEDSYALVRQTAIEYYARLTGSEGTHRLVAALADRDDGVRFSALMALEERLDRELLPAIEPLLEDSYALVRQTAIEYYARLTR